MNRPRPSFTADACMPETRRVCGCEVFVNVHHWPSSTTFMLTAAEAEDWAKRLLAAVNGARHVAVVIEPASCAHTMAGSCALCTHDEPTRKQCSKCLKDCAECKCVGDRAGKGA